MIFDLSSAVNVNANSITEALVGKLDSGHKRENSCRTDPVSWRYQQSSSAYLESNPAQFMRIPNSLVRTTTKLAHVSLFVQHREPNKSSRRLRSPASSAFVDSLGAGY